MPTSPSRKTLLIAVPIAIVVLLLGGWFLIDQIQGDGEDPLTFADATTTTADDASGAADSSSTTTADSDAGSEDGIDGSWTIADGTSTAGYRVKEVLFGSDATATGRTTEVTGTLEVSGTTISATDVEVDMASIESDRTQRDGQFRNRIMSTSEFPTSTFSLTEPIVLDAIPAEGEEITFSATGDLTLRGVTKSVTVDLTAKLVDGTIQVLGTIPIAFDDYEIPDASGGPATVGRDAEMELLLVFSR